MASIALDKRFSAASVVLVINVAQSTAGPFKGCECVRTELHRCGTFALSWTRTI